MEQPPATGQEKTVRPPLPPSENRTPGKLERWVYAVPMAVMIGVAAVAVYFGTREDTDGPPEVTPREAIQGQDIVLTTIDGKNGDGGIEAEKALLWVLRSAAEYGEKTPGGDQWRWPFVLIDRFVCTEPTVETSTTPKGSSTTYYGITAAPAGFAEQPYYGTDNDSRLGAERRPAKPYVVELNKLAALGEKMREEQPEAISTIQMHVDIFKPRERAKDLCNKKGGQLTYTGEVFNNSRISPEVSNKYGVNVGPYALDKSTGAWKSDDDNDNNIIKKLWNMIPNSITGALILYQVLAFIWLAWMQSHKASEKTQYLLFTAEAKLFKKLGKGLKTLLNTSYNALKKSDRTQPNGRHWRLTITREGRIAEESDVTPDIIDDGVVTEEEQRTQWRPVQ